MKPLAEALKRRASRQRWTWWVLPVIVIAGWWYPVLGYFIPLCMVAGIGVALFRGRAWCDWVCPRGSFWDRVLSRASRNGKIPLFFRAPWFRIAVMAVLMSVLATQLPRFWPNIDGMGKVFVTMLTLTTTVGIVLGILTHPRNWCAYCPVGTLGNWLGRGKYPLTISPDCNQCRKCDKICPVQVNRWQHRPAGGEAAVVPEWDCVKCGLCVEACPKKALALGER
jgi:ferredoxin-type protein NapH